jgi:hypothetical protein
MASASLVYPALVALPLFSLKPFCVGIVLQNYILNKQVCEVHDLLLLGV